MNNKAQQVMEDVAKSVIKSIEEGMVSGEWHRPWKGGEIATNAVTGNQYSGGNLIVLWVMGEEFGSQYYATYKQWQSVGAQVRKGEIGTTLVKWIVRECKDHGDDVTCNNCGRGIPSAFTVFNSTQVDGWDGLVQNQEDNDIDIDAFFASTGATIKQVAGSGAFYNKTEDSITVPTFESFESSEAFYATLAHETIHWTGHENRLARTFGDRWGDDKYAAEELVAELGSAMLCATLGISDAPRPEHAQYLKHWVGILKNDYKLLWTAASKARSAVEYVTTLAKKEAKQEVNA